MRFPSALLLLLVATQAPAAVHGNPKLDPNVTRAVATGIAGAWQRGPRTPGRARVLIELTAPATVASLAALEAAGAQLTRVGGQPLFYRRFVPALVTGPGSVAVAALAGVTRVHALPGRGPLPLDRSAQLVRLADARGARPALDLLTGSGMLIGDVDSMVDPFHPSFFKGDGGYYDWIDTNGDGLFTPGTDAIDLDGNGVASPGEVAQLLSATTVSYDDKPCAGRPGGFDPGIDWLYLDSNNNGARDYGVAGGFDDTAPALGEPLFVPDDVNQNGTLDVGERVVRLSTSKFRAIWVSLSYPKTVSALFQRGVNLSATQVNYSNGQIEGFADALHATGVNTILVGDVPLVGRRWVGMAPEAEVALAWDVPDSSLPLDGATWALAQKPDVMLYEMAPWTGTPLDGSDALSMMIDSATEDDQVTNTCPTGDQGSALKHAGASIAAGGQSALPFDLPAHAKGRTAALSYVEVSLNVQGGTPQSLSLTGPNGDRYDLLANPLASLQSGAQYYFTTQTTPRNVWFGDVILYAQSANGGAAPLDVGSWTVTVGGDAANAITVDAYVSDDQSSWAVGAAWDTSVANDQSTIGIPSVADHCIAVNAEPDHLQTPSEPWFDVFYQVYDVPVGYADMDGVIRAYTPRGPRIDGVIKPDVTAPDNPWVATEHDSTSITSYGSFRVFGGTSGASPHVTGVAALLAQAGLRGDAARDALRSGAAHDSLTGAVPNGDYGYGRLDAAGALGVTAVGQDLTVTLAVQPLHPTVADKIQLLATPAGGVDGVEAKWDDGYDGKWDTVYDPALSHPVVAPMPGQYPFKVRVRNSSGHVAEAVTWISVKAAPKGCGCRVGGEAGGGGALFVCVLAFLCIFRARFRLRAR